MGWQSRRKNNQPHSKKFWPYKLAHEIEKMSNIATKQTREMFIFVFVLCSCCYASHNVDSISFRGGGGDLRGGRSSNLALDGGKGDPAAVTNFDTSTPTTSATSKPTVILTEMNTLSGGNSPVPYKPQNIADIFCRSEELTSKGRKLPLPMVMNNLLKYNAFWSAGKIAELHPEAWRTLRTDHPDRLALFYIAPVLARPNVTLSSYIDYEYIHQYHPEWFLLKDGKNVSSGDYRDPNKRIRWADDPTSWYYTCFYLDVGNPAFQDWAVEQFLKKLDPVIGDNDRIRYSGIAADMVMLTTFQDGTTSLHPNWKYASGGWNKAYFSYLRKLHDAMQKRGYILIVNQTLDYGSNRDGRDWQDLMAVADGLMDEEAMLTWSSQTKGYTDRFGGDRWEQSIKHHEDILGKGLYDWWECNFHDYKDPAMEYSNFLYVYCSFLLVKNSDRSLFGIHRRADGVDLDPWYEEYNLPLGNPAGSRYQRQGCWLRDYQHAKIAVNPSSVRCTISLDSDTYTLDWRTKKKITQLALDPLSAAILLPTGYPVN